MTDIERLPVTLLDLLSNSIVLRETAPYLSVQALCRLAKVSKSLRQLVYDEPDIWRHLNLTTVTRAIVKDSTPIDIGAATWRAERMDESLTEDEFYCGPLRGIFGTLHSKRVLEHVQTLILDDLTVPADLVREIIAEERYRVRILSIREARNLNASKLQQVLRYVCRPTRAEGTPVLKALYYFGPKDAPRSFCSAAETVSNIRELGVMSSAGAQIGAEWNQKSSKALDSQLADEEARWYSCTGTVITRPYVQWAETLQVCKGIIAFDAVLCRGPRHDITKVDSKDFLQPTIATIALGSGGCEVCGSCPEKPAIFGESADWTLPLLGPVPHASTVRAALRPEELDGSFPKLIVRCAECLKSRWCEACNRWWCENCYKEPVSRAHLRTEMQQVELLEEIEQSSGAIVDRATSTTATVKVFSKLCVEHCLVNEMMAGAGSNGMWG